MPSIKSLAKIIAHDYPQFRLVVDSVDRWSAQEATIYYNPEQPHATARLLHELSHALLEHRTFKRDIELVAMERDAWHYARTTLAPHYGITITDDTIENDISTYREWLHAKSTCPQCATTGFETSTLQYACPACGHRWTVNLATQRHLRRYAYN